LAFWPVGDIAVGGGRIYWYTAPGVWGAPPAHIGRANIDGSGVEPDFITGRRHRARGRQRPHLLDRVSQRHRPGEPGRIASSTPDHAHRQGAGCGRRRRAHLLDQRRFDRPGEPRWLGCPPALHHGIGSPGPLAVNSGHIYWTDWRSTDAIGRANLDSTGVQRRFITLGWRTFAGLAADGAHLYWASSPPLPRLLALRSSPRKFASAAAWSRAGAWPPPSPTAASQPAPARSGCASPTA
jgi:hypothetical protein